MIIDYHYCSWYTSTNNSIVDSGLFHTHQEECLSEVHFRPNPDILHLSFLQILQSFCLGIRQRRTPDFVCHDIRDFLDSIETRIGRLRSPKCELVGVVK